MGPPPTPLKMFQFAAGVFEMRTWPFLLATFAGKMTQYLVFSLLTIWFGPSLVHDVRMMIRDHRSLVVGISVAAVFLLAFYIVRKLFDRRKGELLPGEDA